MKDIPVIKTREAMLNINPPIGNYDNLKLAVILIFKVSHSTDL